MDELLPAGPVMEYLAQLAARTPPKIKQGVIVTVSPLVVQLAGEIDENDDPKTVPATPYVAGLTVGSRVLCLEQHRRVMVFAVAP